jgi:tRNA-Thr(GGU) m(6)t(6)A37 methyltransferase TsaA
MTVDPVAIVHNTRTAVDDDDWGVVESRLELADGMPSEALDGIETFSHVEVLFYFDRVTSEDVVLTARHPRGNTAWPKVGIFAQRARSRPNRLGSTIAEVVGRNGRSLRVRGLDAVDGTPVLDIKPVIREFLPRAPVRQPDWATELMREYWTRGN